MRNKDTVTCAAETACGCAAAQTASVFRAVNTCAPCQSNGADWNHWDCNARQRNGCDPCENGSGRGSRCPRNICNDHAPSNACGSAAAAGGCEPCGAYGSCNAGAAEACNGCNSCNAFGGCETCSVCGAAAERCSCRSSCNARGGCEICPVCGAAAEHCRCRRNATPAMVYEAPHCLDNLHAIEEAIRKGTLFSELYMPMNGECADNCGAQLCDGQAEAFAAWELRLYLNTHPCDEQALRLFRKLARKADQPNYAGAFAFDDSCPDRWSWTDAPWPWEFNAACENNCCCN